METIHTIGRRKTSVARVYLSSGKDIFTVNSKDFKPVVDACTLCDMCFLTKCPYVPPHEFNLDFPHLMLRYRVLERKKGKIVL